MFAVSSSNFIGCEYNWAGAIGGEPIEVITEEVTGLPIPAGSEVVIAGWCPPDKARMEGPFGEWTGYYGSMERPAPIIEVERIYHRNAPILTGNPTRRPPSEVTWLQVMLGSAILHNELIRSGIPDVRGVWLNENVLQPLMIVSIKQRYAGHAKNAALAALLCKQMDISRYVIVVDEDIDPTNIRDVIWALCFRSDPEKDVDIIRKGRTSTLDPIIHKPATVLQSSRMIIDACKPYEWIDEFPKTGEISPDVAAKFREKWKWLFAG